MFPVTVQSLNKAMQAVLIVAVLKGVKTIAIRKMALEKIKRAETTETRKMVKKTIVMVDVEVVEDAKDAVVEAVEVVVEVAAETLQTEEKNVLMKAGTKKAATNKIVALKETVGVKELAEVVKLKYSCKYMQIMSDLSIAPFSLNVADIFMQSKTRSSTFLMTFKSVQVATDDGPPKYEVNDSVGISLIL